MSMSIGDSFVTWELIGYYLHIFVNCCRAICTYHWRWRRRTCPFQLRCKVQYLVILLFHVVCKFSYQFILSDLLHKTYNYSTSWSYSQSVKPDSVNTWNKVLQLFRICIKYSAGRWCLISAAIYYINICKLQVQVGLHCNCTIASAVHYNCKCSAVHYNCTTASVLHFNSKKQRVNSLRSP